MQMSSTTFLSRDVTLVTNHAHRDVQIPPHVTRAIQRANHVRLVAKEMKMRVPHVGVVQTFT